MRFECHVHTHYSKGSKIRREGLDSPKEIIKHARRIGLEGIVITDHDTVKGAIKAMEYGRRYGIEVIPGTEVSTSDGHLLALGIKENIPPFLPVDVTVEMIHDLGGIAVAPHPFDIKKQGLGKKCMCADAIEVFNGISLDRVSNAKAMHFARCNNLIGINGSDAHCAEMLGYTTMETDEDIVEAIAKNRVQLKNNYVSIDAMVYWIIKRFQDSYPDTKLYIEEHYRFPKKILYMKLLNLTRLYPYISRPLKLLSYIGLLNVIIYSSLRSIR